MTFRRIPLHLFLLSTFITSFCIAAPSPAISRFDKPKYAPDFTAASYVNSEAPKGGRLKLATIGTFDTVNPFVVKGIAAEGTMMMFDPLMKRLVDDPHSWYGLIAEKAEIAPDSSSITFYLNPTARFHNGAQITAEDVKYTVELLRDKGLPRFGQFYGRIQEIVIKSPQVITFIFKQQENGYDRELPMVMAALRPLSKAAMTGIDIQNSSLQPLVGSGPYKLAEQEQGRSIAYERIGDYWAANLPVNKGQYNFDKIVIEYYKNSTALFSAFKVGEFDAYFEADQKEWHTAYNFKAVTQGKVKLTELAHKRPVTVRTLIFNMRRPLFQDWRVRKALTLALDFNAINKMLFHGANHQMTSLFANTAFVPTASPEGKALALLTPYKAEIPAEIFTGSVQLSTAKTPQDQRQYLMQASQLLEEAGWIIEKGVRIHKDTKQPLAFEFLLKDPRLEKLALAYAQALKPLGVALKVNRIDTVQYEKRAVDHDFDMIAHSWTNTLSPGVEQKYYFNPEVADTPGSSNYIGLKDVIAYALAGKVADAKNEEDLTAAVQALDRVVMGNYYMVPVFYDNKLCFAYWVDRVAMPEIKPEVGTNAMEWWWAK